MARRDEERTLELRRHLAEEIRRDREDLRSALHEVKQATRAAVSLNRMIRERPAIWLASAFVLGFVVGSRH